MGTDTMNVSQCTLRIAVTALLTFGAMSAVASAVLLTPIEAQAQDKGSEAITVQIRTIYATTDAKGVDPKLSDLKGKLVGAFETYGTFKELASHQTTLNTGGSYEFSIPGGNRLVVSHKGPEGKDAKTNTQLIKLGLGVTDKFKSDVRVSRGTTLFQAGLPHGSGILILAITVR
ncbi:MAG: hypothetical protein CMH57_12605 [Myxococcales bacterium]|nr:hypothetical protein [Myxococcales bacterium]